MKKEPCEFCGRASTTTHIMRVEGTTTYHAFNICQKCLSWRKKVLSRAFNNILKVDSKAKRRVSKSLLKLINEIDTGTVEVKKATIVTSNGYSKFQIVVKRSKVLA